MLAFYLNNFLCGDRTMASAAEINEIVKLYVGYYNRAPDPIGLNFWIKSFDGGFGLDKMASPL